MSKIDQINKAKALLNQAINATTYPNEPVIIEAQTHMRQALQKLESASHKHTKYIKKAEQNYKNWWSNIVANSPFAKTSSQKESKEAEKATMKTLKHLDSMMSEQQKIINDLETKIVDKPKQKVDDSTGLLMD